MFTQFIFFGIFFYFAIKVAAHLFAGTASWLDAALALLRALLYGILVFLIRLLILSHL